MDKTKQNKMSWEFQELCDQFLLGQELLIKKHKLKHGEDITALLTTYSLLLQTTFKEDTLQALEDIKNMTQIGITKYGSVTKYLESLGNG